MCERWMNEQMDPQIDNSTVGEKNCIWLCCMQNIGHFVNSLRPSDAYMRR